MLISNNIRKSTRISQRRLTLRTVSSTPLVDAPILLPLSNTKRRIDALSRLLLQNTSPHQPINVPSDGNCLFSSLLDSFHNAQYTTASQPRVCHDRNNVVRSMVCTEMRNHYRIVGLNGLQQDAESSDINDSETYIKRMERNGQWGGKPEIKAFGRLFHCTIHIYTLNTAETDITDEIFVFHASTRPTVYMGFLHNHYVSVRRCNGRRSVERSNLATEDDDCIAIETARRLKRRRQERTCRAVEDNVRQRRLSMDRAKRLRGESQVTEDNRLYDLKKFQRFLKQQHEHDICTSCSELIEQCHAVCRSCMDASFGASRNTSLDDYLRPLCNVEGKLILEEKGISRHENGCMLSVTMCRSCDESLKKAQCPAFALARGYTYATIPPELLSLTWLEMSLVSRYVPFISWDRLPAGRQWGTHGNAVLVHNPLSLSELETQLPRSLSRIKVVTESSTGNARIQSRFSSKHRYVRVAEVRSALAWLKDNNELYRDVTVNHEALSQMEMLSVNGRVDLHAVDSVCRVAVNSADTSTSEDCRDVDAVGGLDDNTVVVETLAHESNNDGNVLQTLHRYLQREEEQTLRIPATSANDLVSEFSGPSPFALAFPQLFPNGVGDYERNIALGPKRSELDFIQHLLKLSDRRFANSKQFLFYVYSRTQRLRISNVVSVASGRFIPLSDRRTPVMLSDMLKEIERQMQLRNASESATMSERLPITGDADVAETHSTHGSETITAPRNTLCRHFCTVDEVGVCSNPQHQTNVEKASVYSTAVRNAVNSLVPYADQLRGSPSYWKRRQIELSAMIASLGSPTWFLTLSAADSMLPELFRFLCPTCDDVTTLTVSRRQELLAEHPVDAARFFYRRVEEFWKLILNGKLKPLGRIVDFWWRVEFQHRGSPHVHSMIWLHPDDAPDLANMLSTDDGRARLAAFVDIHVTASPAASITSIEEFERLADIATASKPPPSQVYAPIVPMNSSDHNNAALIDCVGVFKTSQLHVCQPRACHMMKPRQKCRYHFPMKLQDKTVVVSRHKNHRRQTVACHHRYHPWLNPCNIPIAISWRGNHDVKVVGNASGAAIYISYYVSKPEGDSDQLTKAMTSMMESVVSASTTRSQFLAKVARTALKATPISAQHVAWIMQGLPMFRTSRQWICLVVTPLRERAGVVQFERPVMDSTSTEQAQNQTTAPISVASIHQRRRRGSRHKRGNPFVDDEAMADDDDTDDGHNSDDGDLCQDFLESNHDTNSHVMSDIDEEKTNAYSGNDVQVDDDMPHASSTTMERRGGLSIRTRNNKHYRSYVDRSVSLEHVSWFDFCQQYTLTKRPQQTDELKQQTAQEWAVKLPVEEYRIVYTIPELMEKPDNEGTCYSLLLLYKPWRTESEMLKDESGVLCTAIDMMRQWKARSGDAAVDEYALRMQRRNDMREYLKEGKAGAEAADRDRADILQDSQTDPNTVSDDRSNNADDSQWIDMSCSSPHPSPAVIHENSGYTPKHVYTESILQRIDGFVTEVTHAALQRRNARNSMLDSTAQLAVVSDVFRPEGTAMVDLQLPLTATDRLLQMISSLNDQQKLAYTMITDQLALQYNAVYPRERLQAGGAMLVTGGGGTGKSYLIKALDLYCRSIAEQQQHVSASNERSGMFNLVAKLAYTGVAAYNIGGRTIHSAFGIGGRTNEEKKRRDLLSHFHSVRLIIIDEISLVSPALLYKISQYLQLAREDDTAILKKMVDAATTSDDWKLIGNAHIWGGFVVVLCGDPFQLPPVAGRSLFMPSNAMEKGDDEKGFALWRLLTKVVILSRSVRQQSDNAFAEMLNRLRLGRPSVADVCTLNTRRVTGDAERRLLLARPNIVQAYATNEEVNAANQRRLRTLRPPYFVSWCCHQPSAKMKRRSPAHVQSEKFRHDALLISNDKVGPKSLVLAIGARVMLTVNSVVEGVLVNGSTGIVYDVLANGAHLSYEQLTCTSERLASMDDLQPLTVLVQFDKEFYSSDMPSLLDQYGIPRVVPITAIASRYAFPLTCNSDGRGVSMEVKRWQLPLKVSWALTIHKTQGLTCENGLIVDIAKCKRPGSAYVAVSRVRRLDDLFITDQRLTCDSFRCDNALIKEYDRLTRLAQETQERFSV